MNVQLAESTLDLAQQDLKSFQNTVDISEARYKAGDMSEADYLKIELQMLQFQIGCGQCADVASRRRWSVCGNFWATNRCPADFDVAGDLEYQPLKSQGRRSGRRWH